MEIALFIGLIIFYLYVSTAIYINDLKDKKFEEELFYEEEQKEFSSQKEEA